MLTWSSHGDERRLSAAADGRDMLIVVAKRPAPGQTKTRLCPPLTPEEGASLYECFLRDTLDVARRVPGIRRAIAYLPLTDEPYFRQLAADMDLIGQEGDSLGERLDNAVSHYLRLGYRRVAVMNSDGPTLPPEYLAEAFSDQADDADVVLGPSEDGGYYLIGLRRPAPRLLREVRMSTPTVAAETVALATSCGLSVHLLPTWYDVDDAAGLRRLASELAQAAADVAPQHAPLLAPPSAGGTGRLAARPTRRRANVSATVAVIIPALNEAGNIGPLVRALIACGPHAVIVVDNGSSDATASEAADAGARVVREERRGYGYACAAGAAAAGEDVLAFLDGDGSCLPSELPAVVQPLLRGEADLVLGSRRGRVAAGAMPWQQVLGNRLVAWLVRGLYGLDVADLGPYRAIRADLLRSLGMREMTYGWPTEMLVKAARAGVRVVEVPVRWEPRRHGRSKVSGTLRGTILAAWFMVGVALRYAWHRPGTYAGSSGRG